jgi:hypothetical protein
MLIINEIEEDKRRQEIAEKARKEGQAKVRAEEAKAMATQFKQERK